MFNNNELIFGQNVYSSNSISPQSYQNVFTFEQKQAVESANLLNLLMQMNQLQSNNSTLNSLSTLQIPNQQQILQQHLQLQQPLSMNTQTIQPVLSTQNFPHQIYLQNIQEQNQQKFARFQQPAQFFNGRPQNMLLQQQPAIAFQQQQFQQIQNHSNLQQNLFNFGSNNLIGSQTTFGSVNDLSPVKEEYLAQPKQQLSIIEQLQLNEQIKKVNSANKTQKRKQNESGDLKIKIFGDNLCKYLKTEETQSSFSDKTIQLNNQQSPILPPQTTLLKNSISISNGEKKISKKEKKIISVKSKDKSKIQDQKIQKENEKNESQNSQTQEEEAKRNNAAPYQTYAFDSMVQNQLRKQILKSFFKCVSTTFLEENIEQVSKLCPNLNADDLKNLKQLCNFWSKLDNEKKREEFINDDFKKISDQLGYSQEIRPLGQKCLKQIFCQNNEYSKVLKFLFENFNGEQKINDKRNEQMNMVQHYNETFTKILQTISQD